MAHDGTMTAPATRTDTPLTRAKAAIRDLPAWLAGLSGPALGGAMIELREMIVCEEAAFAIALRRFDKSGEYKADGAVSLVEWLRSMCRLSGGAAAERVGDVGARRALPGNHVNPLTIELFADSSQVIGANADPGRRWR